MTQLNQTLSVVLTVHNAEQTLATHVTKLLDVLPDLAHRFELLIVDDGSTDQTEEVAHELARDYPQLRVTRHAEQLGSDGAARTALEEATGDVVILHESTSGATREVRALRPWQSASDAAEHPASRTLRLLQDPALMRPRVAGPAAVLDAEPRGPRLIPRRVAQPAIPGDNATLRTDPAGGSLPRILALLLARRTSTANSDATIA